jgi:hypothetical protein
VDLHHLQAHRLPLAQAHTFLSTDQTPASHYPHIPNPNTPLLPKARSRLLGPDLVPPRNISRVVLHKKRTTYLRNACTTTPPKSIPATFHQQRMFHRFRQRFRSQRSASPVARAISYDVHSQRVTAPKGVVSHMSATSCVVTQGLWKV